FPDFAEQFPEIPSLIYKALDNAAHAKQQAELQNRELILMRRQMARNHRRTVWAMLVSAAAISAAVLFR
ncbi:MAG: ubiquinone biosynthesis regulatory protein kinase UbiB, partial [Gammaproteobacteria bacterium]